MRYLNFILSIALLTLGSVFLQADPSEKEHAWPNAPHGWHLQELGPRTETVDTASYGRIVHVSATKGNDRKGNGTREKPFQTIQAALSGGSESTADNRTAVLVAGGIYSETPVKMAAFVDLYGGYDPVSWERNIFEHPTTLDALKKSRVVIGSDDTRLDGFIVTGGEIAGHGAGIYCYRTSPKITNNVIRNNHVLAPADFERDADRLRKQGNYGGGIGLEYNSKAKVLHNLIIHNTTEIGYGAGLGAKDDCMPQVGYNVFFGNRAGAGDADDTRSSNGGALALIASSRAGVLHNLFVDNQALGESDGGAIFCEYFSWPIVRWNIFLNNHAGDDGGGLDSQKFSYPRVKYNMFFGNNVNGSGGGVHGDDSLIMLENNIFAYNTAKSHAGALGGSHVWLHIVNNTVVHNTSDKHGGGVYYYNTKNPFLKVPVVRNNIFSHNEPDEVFFEPHTDASYNLIRGGFETAYGVSGHEPGFLDDGLTLTASSSRYDGSRFQTTIMMEGLTAHALKDRVVRMGDEWTLVTDNNVESLTVWGKFDMESGSELEIIPTFHLAPDSASINRGIYADFAADDIDGQQRYFPTIDLGADEYVPEGEE